jgi:diguanylate cyclase (GGDEF)-like protein
LVAACFDLWLTVRGGNRFALGWYLSKCGSLITSFVVIASLFHDIAQLYRNSAAANRVLTDLAHRDGLTGVRNRRYFDESLEAEWTRARSASAPLSLLMVDVDHFKQFNDQYGHVLGDDGLRAVARCLTEAVRQPTDIVARYGGEEFAVLLPGVDESRSLEVAERLRTAVENLAIPHRGSPAGRLTISVGASSRIPDLDGKPHALLRNADCALYLAKNRGRNRIASSAQVRRDISPGALVAVSATKRPTFSDDEFSRVLASPENAQGGA